MYKLSAFVCATAIGVLYKNTHIIENINKKLNE